MSTIPPLKLEDLDQPTPPICVRQCSWCWRRAVTTCCRPGCGAPLCERHLFEVHGVIQGERGAVVKTQHLCPEHAS